MNVGWWESLETFERKFEEKEVEKGLKALVDRVLDIATLSLICRVMCILLYCQFISLLICSGYTKYFLSIMFIIYSVCILIEYLKVY